MSPIRTVIPRQNFINIVNR